MNKKAKDKKKVYAPRNEDVRLLFIKRETALSSRRSKDRLVHKGMHGGDARALHVRATPHYANQGMQVCKDFASAGGAF